MQPLTTGSDAQRQSSFVDSLSAFSRQHRAQHWEGNFNDFLTRILPASPAALARASHQYIWDMLRWYGRTSEGPDEASRACELFKRELFGVDEPLARVVDYFKAAAAGSVDLSTVAEVGAEGDPRAWSWSGAVYAASRGVLEMIEILKVKREFLYLLLTLTQEKNVKVSL